MEAWDWLRCQTGVSSPTSKGRPGTCTFAPAAARACRSLQAAAWKKEAAQGQGGRCTWNTGSSSGSVTCRDATSMANSYALSTRLSGLRSCGAGNAREVGLSWAWRRWAAIPGQTCNGGHRRSPARPLGRLHAAAGVHALQPAQRARKQHSAASANAKHRARSPPARRSPYVGAHLGDDGRARREEVGDGGVIVRGQQAAAGQRDVVAQHVVRLGAAPRGRVGRLEEAGVVAAGGAGQAGRRGVACMLGS